MGLKAWGTLVALATAVAVVAMLAGIGGGGATAAPKPITIGWAFDGSGQMAPFDGPAMAAANVRIKQVNSAGGVNGRKLRIISCDTQNNDPARAKSCAISLLGQGADIIFTTCDVDYATPVVQEAINRGKLAISTCIGTDQMGPKRFGRPAGTLAYSFGNVAQDEGSAMAEFAYRHGWRRAALATNTLLVYFKNVVTAFDKRFTQLGGRIVARESYATGANNVQTAVARLNSARADVIVTSTAFGELPALVSGLRSLGNKTPILNSWAGDGTYWLPQSPKVTEYYCVTYASVFGDDPSVPVKKMIAAMKAAGGAPATGGFMGGAAAIDGMVLAIKRANGSLNGAKLSAQLQKFHQERVFGSRISFSAKYHTVFGRQYRVIRINNNVAKRYALVTAKVLPNIG
jgi:branched-chain amino acid transport system substrate-binding protein